MKNWVAMQDELASASSAEERPTIYYSVVGLHAITLPQDPAELRRESRDMLAALLALGLDPEKCTLFRQEQVPEHAELAWYLNCIAPFGRLQRMTTWKVGSAGASLPVPVTAPLNACLSPTQSRIATKRNANSVEEVDESMLHLGLFAYPVLQAADVLLYQATEVPVGEDQGQHIELVRDLGASFNKTFRQDVFTIPRHVYSGSCPAFGLHHSRGQGRS